MSDEQTANDEVERVVGAYPAAPEVNLDTVPPPAEPKAEEPKTKGKTSGSK